MLTAALRMVATWLLLLVFDLAAGSPNVGATDHPASRDGLVVRASAAGAALDSNLMRGGGKDDTAILQRLLDQAKTGTPVYLLIDGPALTTGLDVHGNTTIECIAGAGLYLKDGSSRAIIRNSNRSRNAIADENITIRGCFMNGNRSRQPGAESKNAISKNQERDGSYIAGLQFLGVNHLAIEKVVLWAPRSFAVHIANANWIDIRDVVVDHGAPGDTDLQYANVDGLHFNGPVRYLMIDGLKLRSVDDAVALNANDSASDDITVNDEMGPYVGQGPITDVVITNVILDTVQGIRILSSTERIDRVMISNVTGMIKGNYLASIGRWVIPHGRGNVGSVTIGNVHVERSGIDSKIATELADLIRGYKDHENPKRRDMYEEFNGTIVPLINVNGKIESLNLLNIRTSAFDERPILRFGESTRVETITAELSIRDPGLRGVPIELDSTALIHHFRLSLDWRGTSPDEGRMPFVMNGGSVGSLQWINTPPLFIVARRVVADPFCIDVLFNQKLKAKLSLAGARVEIEGRAVRVVKATLQPDGHTVRYKLESRMRNDQTVTWAYDAVEGDIQNLDGSFLLSVSQKPVAPII